MASQRTLKRKLRDEVSDLSAKKGFEGSEESDEDLTPGSSNPATEESEALDEKTSNDDGKEKIYEAKLPEELLKTFTKPAGVLLIAGMVSWDHIGKRDNHKAKLSHNNLYTFHRFTDIKFRLAVSGCNSAHSILISESGTAYTFGRNNRGQLGLGDTINRNLPTVVPKLKDEVVIHAATGPNHSLFVTDTGAVYACGDNRCGQCGIGNTTTQEVLTPTRIKYTGAPVVKVSCGSDFSFILDINGTLHAFGSPEFGQLGNNSDGKYFVTSTKLSFQFETVPRAITTYCEKTKEGHTRVIPDVQIVDVACGKNHTVAIDSNKRVFSWGFGGFGRLGHSMQKDEMVPRLIKYFETQSRGVRSVYAGSSYSLAVNELGSLFLFGQTKRTGEANMYPKPVQDLSGWNIRSIGTSNTSIVVAADNSLISWGVSPTYGELGLGELCKSTPRPKEVSKMDGLNITHVTMGYSHCLILCDDSSEQAREKLAEIKMFTPTENPI